MNAAGSCSLTTRLDVLGTTRYAREPEGSAPRSVAMRTGSPPCTSRARFDLIRVNVS
jgi:hypothetical protein